MSIDTASVQEYLDRLRKGLNCLSALMSIDTASVQEYLDRLRKGLNCLSALMSIDTVPYFCPINKGVSASFLTADGKVTICKFSQCRKSGFLLVFCKIFLDG
jgi:hypothetical protein